MWAGVTKRFRDFHRSLQLTVAEVDDGTGKQLGVRQCLERAYWGPTSANPPGFMVGSWGKGTAIRPPNDVDVFMQLPLDVYHRFDGYAGNGQSALLQEVKGHLENTYGQTRMRGDGQVVVVGFNTVTIEVVPVFRYDDDRWVMPDTNNGGGWKNVSPSAEFRMLNSADAASRSNARPLIQIMKAWKYHCSVPIKSFALEILVAEFITEYQFRDQDYFYYDWFVRDFLEFLLNKRNSLVWAPSSADLYNVGDEWVSRAQTAYDRAKKACDFEREDMVVSAGDEWQKIFGPRIPLLP